MSLRNLLLGAKLNARELLWLVVILAAILFMTLPGCALPRFIPACEGEPSVMPCTGPCKVRIAGPQPVEQYMSDAIVIRDEITKKVHCQAVRFPA